MTREVILYIISYLEPMIYDDDDDDDDIANSGLFTVTCYKYSAEALYM